MIAVALILAGCGSPEPAEDPRDAEIRRLREEKAALETEVAKLRKETGEAEQKARDFQAVIEDLERSGPPVFPIVLNTRPVPPINGKVAGVRTDLQPALVVLDVENNKDEARKGYQFTIFRDKEFVGKVVVEKVMADACTARVLFTAPGKTIQQGDSAATKIE